MEENLTSSMSGKRTATLLLTAGFVSPGSSPARILHQKSRSACRAWNRTYFSAAFMLVAATVVESAWVYATSRWICSRSRSVDFPPRNRRHHKRLRQDSLCKVCGDGCDSLGCTKFRTPKTLVEANYPDMSLYCEWRHSPFGGCP
jgi:hypothetical protein